MPLGLEHSCSLDTPTCARLVGAPGASESSVRLRLLDGDLQVADDLITQDFGGHEFERAVVFGDDKHDDFVEHAIFQLNAAILKVNANGIALGLGVHVLELQGDGSDRC